MVISCGYYSRAAFILFRASDCAATFRGRPLFEKMRYILGESLLTIKTYQVMTSFSSMPNSAVEVKIKSTVSKNPEQLPLILGSLLLLGLHTGIYRAVLKLIPFPAVSLLSFLSHSKLWLVVIRSKNFSNALHKARNCEFCYYDLSGSNSKICWLENIYRYLENIYRYLVFIADFGF